MANKKFSQFNQLASATGTTELVGFDGANNVRVLASTLGGGGYEPYERNVLIYPRQINGSFPNCELFKFNASKTINQSTNFACPFWVQKKLNITRFRIRPNTSNTNIALCLYKYTSESANGNFFDLTFTLDSQTSLLNFPTNGTQYQTLSTPLVVEPESVYIIVCLPNSGTSISYQGLKDATFSTANPTFFESNNFLGATAGNNSDIFQIQSSLLLNSGNGVVTGGVAPNTLTFQTRFPSAAAIDYIAIGLENA